jgi:hypothetical protein
MGPMESRRIQREINADNICKNVVQLMVEEWNDTLDDFEKNLTSL